MPLYDERFVQWAQAITHTGQGFEQEVGGRLGIQGILNAIVKLSPAGRLDETEVIQHAIGWVVNELTHSPVSITHDQARAVKDSAESFIYKTLA